MLSSLIFNISSNHICGYFIPYTPNKVTIAPQFSRPKLFPQLPKLLENLSCRYTLQYLHCFRRRIFRRYFYKYVYMVFHYLHGIYPKPVFIRYLPNYLFRILCNLSYQDLLPILRYPDHMVFDIKNSVFCSSKSHASFIHGKAAFKQSLVPRLTASHFPPASKLAGIQWSFL